jgi:hypothetical protein
MPSPGGGAQSPSPAHRAGVPGQPSARTSQAENLVSPNEHLDAGVASAHAFALACHSSRGRRAASRWSPLTGHESGETFREPAEVFPRRHNADGASPGSPCGSPRASMSRRGIARARAIGQVPVGHHAQRGCRPHRRPRHAVRPTVRARCEMGAAGGAGRGAPPARRRHARDPCFWRRARVGLSGDRTRSANFATHSKESGWARAHGDGFTESSQRTEIHGAGAARRLHQAAARDLRW